MWDRSVQSKQMDYEDDDDVIESMSVANKDEALKCITIAKKAINDGNFEKARKFLLKSKTLHPLNEADVFLNLVKMKEEKAGSSSSKQNDSPNSASKDSDKQSDGESSSKRDCTPEMVAAVNKVKGKKDLYDVLGCSKTASDNDLKKAYKKLALALHPDKNCAPGAQEAFKAVGHAFAVLSDKDKRAHYDRYGNEEDYIQRSPGTRAYYTRHRNREFYFDDDDISAEELFNMFFGGMQPRRQHHRHTYYRAQDSTAEHNNTSQFISNLLQMSPLLLLILMSILNSLFVEDPAYSYSGNSQYSVEQKTRWNSVKYFVKRDFSETHTEEKKIYLEYDIEREYKNDLQIKCINNSRRREQLIYQYRVTGNVRYKDYAESIDMAPCTDFKNFKLPQYIRN